MRAHQTTLLDAMRDAAVERVRFKRGPAGLTVRAAAVEGEWTDAEKLLPTSEADIAWVSELMKRGGHERFDLVFREQVGLRFLCAVHSSRLGPGAGGLRRHDLVVPEAEVFSDVLNLARAMTYKNAASDLGRGGSKLCVHNPGIPDYDREAWLDALAEEIELSGTLTGPDTGYPQGVFLDLAERSSQVSGVRGGGTSRAAAHGLYLALRAGCAGLGIPLSEARIAIQGLGALGLGLAEALVKDGSQLTVTDRDHRRIDTFFQGLSSEDRRRVGVVAPYQILDVDCDLFSPCALGGVITPENVETLKMRAICGGANNQLAGNCLEDELALARRLHEREILYVPDWLASAGGSIHGILEHLQGEAFDPKAARARIGRLCGWEVDALLERAKRGGRAPLVVAVERLLDPDLR